ncbi:MAG: hypothetical protein MUO68_06490, partial [Desulfobacteraceae bacterium]|nr:hypothetical protein [Desulfobacteraceae bacterium]
MLTKKTALLAIFSFAILLTIFNFGRWDPARGGTRETRETKIQGRVVSQYGPLENARVRVQGDDRYALTDRQGMFELSTSLPPGGRVRITAGKEGWFNNVQIASLPGPMGDIFLNPVYLNDQTGYRFISPVTCASCH